MSNPVPGRFLRLSRYLAFFRRAEARFVHHQLTGSVAEMSEGVLRHLLGFGTAGREPARDDRFAPVLAREGLLVPLEASPERTAFDHWHVVRYRWAVWEEDPEEGTTLWLPDGSSRRLGDEATRIWVAADTSPTLAELVAKHGDGARDAVFSLTRAEVGYLKLAPRLDPLPPGLHSSMPFERFDPLGEQSVDARGVDPRDLRRYHSDGITDAGEQFDVVETTLSHLLRDPHAALGGRAYGHAVADALLDRKVLADGAVIVEIGGGAGYLAARVIERLGERAPSALRVPGATWIGVDLAPALLAAQRQRLAGVSLAVHPVRGDAAALPVRSGSVDLVLANEMAGDLTVSLDEAAVRACTGACELVREAARILRPGGILFLTEFGDPDRPPVRSTHLDHDEHSIRFNELVEVAAETGLTPELWCVPDLIDLRGSGDLDPALWTTRGSYAALRALLRSHGVELAKRAWSRSELEAILPAGLHVGGLVYGPLEERTMGLRPRDFWALIARKPGP